MHFGNRFQHRLEQDNCQNDQSRCGQDGFGDEEGFLKTAAVLAAKPGFGRSWLRGQVLRRQPAAQVLAVQFGLGVKTRQRGVQALSVLGLGGVLEGEKTVRQLPEAKQRRQAFERMGVPLEFRHFAGGVVAVDLGDAAGKFG